MLKRPTIRENQCDRISRFSESRFNFRFSLHTQADIACLRFTTVRCFFLLSASRIIKKSGTRENTIRKPKRINPKVLNQNLFFLFNCGIKDRTVRERLFSKKYFVIGTSFFLSLYLLSVDLSCKRSTIDADHDDHD